jgi:lysophospholipase L1-like esterase
MKSVLAFIICFVLWAGCSKAPSASSSPDGVYVPDLNVPVIKTVSYLALGDSYTVGESVIQDQSFPYQLKAGLRSQRFNVPSIQMVAKAGWTTAELKAAIAATSLTGKFDLVTLLIGVNNQYRGDSKDTYRKEFVELLNTASNFAGGDRKKVFVLSIPDWGYTPFGRNGMELQISKDIDDFNLINKEETLKLNISYTDITVISRQALNNTPMLAPDGLHPSGKMYKLWVDELLPKVKEVL